MRAQALSKLAEIVDGRYDHRRPPVIVPSRHRRSMACRCKIEAGRDQSVVPGQPRDDQRHLLERFEVIDMARKVVGVGSVGTRAFIVLLQGRDQQDPLFLQVKEATGRCWKSICPRSRCRQPGSASCRASG